MRQKWPRHSSCQMGHNVKSRQMVELEVANFGPVCEDKTCPDLIKAKSNIVAQGPLILVLFCEEHAQILNQHLSSDM